jgi:hypothetical protein
MGSAVLVVVLFVGFAGGYGVFRDDVMLQRAEYSLKNIQSSGPP